MQEDISAQITRLEMLYSEQEHTIQTLNEVATRQDQEMGQLRAELQLLKQQFNDLKTGLPQQDIGDEIPPHY